MSPVLVNGGQVQIAAIDVATARVATSEASSASVRSESATVTIAPAAPTAVSVVSTGVLPGPPGRDGGSVAYPVTPAATWTVRHNLGRYVEVTLLDDAGAEIDADVEQPDLNTVVVTHARPIAGVVLVS